MKRLVCVVASFTVAALAAPASASSTGDVIYVDVFGKTGIHAISPDGTGHSHPVSDEAYRPVWAPDGSGFAFATGTHWNKVDWADADGSNRHTLISPREQPDGWELGAISWSPDGTKLLLSLQKRDLSAERVYVFPKDGSTNTLIARNASSADWGSNNKIVARSGRYLVTMNANGTHMQQIDGTHNGGAPAWSPDASRILFGRGRDIWVIDANGTNVQQLTDTEAIDFSAAWSPTVRASCGDACATGTPGPSCGSCRQTVASKGASPSRPTGTRTTPTGGSRSEKLIRQPRSPGAR